MSNIESNKSNKGNMLLRDSSNRQVVDEERKRLIFIRHLIKKCYWNVEEFGYCPVCKAEEYKSLEVEGKNLVFD